MKEQAKLNLGIVGSVLALLLASSCCWLPFLAAVVFGATVGTTALSQKMAPLSGLLMAVGAGLLVFSGWQFFQKRKNRNQTTSIVLQSEITCPECGFQKTETMPTDACQYFYQCENCGKLLKPKAGDCCVFCSYGTVKCPPIQAGNACC